MKRRLHTIVPIVLIVVGLAMVTMGTLYATVLKPSGVVSADTANQGKGSFTVSRPGVLELNAPEATITVKGKGDVVVAIGRTTDVNGWVADQEYVEITGIKADNKLAIEQHKAVKPDKDKEPVDPKTLNPVDADHWQKLAKGNKSAELTWPQKDGQWSLLAYDSEGKPDVTITWKTKVSMAWLIPIFIFGALFLVGGIVWLLLSRRAIRKVAQERKYQPSTQAELPTTDDMQEGDLPAPTDTHEGDLPAPTDAHEGGLPAAAAVGASSVPLDQGSEMVSEGGPVTDDDVAFHESDFVTTPADDAAVPPATPTPTGEGPVVSAAPDAAPQDVDAGEVMVSEGGPVGEAPEPVPDYFLDDADRAAVDSTYDTPEAPYDAGSSYDAGTSYDAAHDATASYDGATPDHAGTSYDAGRSYDTSYDGGAYDAGSPYDTGASDISNDVDYHAQVPYREEPQHPAPAVPAGDDDATVDYAVPQRKPYSADHTHSGYSTGRFPSRRELREARRRGEETITMNGEQFSTGLTTRITDDVAAQQQRQQQQQDHSSAFDGADIFDDGISDLAASSHDNQVTDQPGPDSVDSFGDGSAWDREDTPSWPQVHQQPDQVSSDYADSHGDDLDPSQFPFLDEEDIERVDEEARTGESPIVPNNYRVKPEDPEITWENGEEYR